MTHYDFSRLYAEIFLQSPHLINQNSWSFPLIEKFGNKASQGEDNFFYSLDLSNIEGFLNLQLPMIRDSLELTFSRFGGVKKKMGRPKKKGSGIEFI